MTYIFEGKGAHVKEAGVETPLKAGDFALINPDEKHQCPTRAINPSR
jgi:quercetin dioxygenase-like cupin family protein